LTQNAGIKDRYGLSMSTSSPTAAERFVEGLDLFLSAGYGAEDKFQEAIEADEGFALAHGALGLIMLLRIRPADAKASVETAQALAPGVSAKEQRQIQAIALSINGQGPQALAVIKEHMKEYPRDALMLRMGQRLFLLGCNGAGVPNYPQELFALLKSVASEYGDDWAFQGQYSFAHHETGQIEEARKLAERSLAQWPTNAVASHSEAHVFFEVGDHSVGADFLSDWIKEYDKRASFFVHLSWHHALFELAKGNYRRAVALYEEGIRPSVVENNVASLADSAALLWRLKMYGGVSLDGPWGEVRDLAAPAADAPGMAFRDAHAALAFAASGDEKTLGRMIDGLREMANKGNALAGEAILPLVQGIGAFAQGEYASAVDFIEPAFGHFTRLGGSHAQREVFEDTLLEAYLRAEQFDKAEDLLRARLKRRTSARDMFWLGRAQAEVGQPEAAGASFEEAITRWQDAESDSPELASLNHLAGKTG
jgi:tetratricopeptide (TPR) repeat protein